MDMRFGTWKVRSPCRVGSLKTVGSELAKYNFGVVAVQEVRWDKGGSQPAEVYAFSCSIGPAIT